jgi:hypothetical protein
MNRVVRSAPQYPVRNPPVNHIPQLSILDPIALHERPTETFRMTVWSNTSCLYNSQWNKRRETQIDVSQCKPKGYMKHTTSPWVMLCMHSGSWIFSIRALNFRIAECAACPSRRWGLYSHYAYSIKKRHLAHRSSYVYAFFMWNKRLGLLNFWFTWTWP